MCPIPNLEKWSVPVLNGKRHITHYMRDQRSVYIKTHNMENIRMLTVVPSARERSNVFPAGTVNELMFTVVHLTAAETSSKDEMVPVQSVAAGAAVTTDTSARTAARRRILDIAQVKL